MKIQKKIFLFFLFASLCPDLVISKETKSLPKTSSQLIWENWYTVTLQSEENKPFHYSYYKEKLETIDDKIHYESHQWKKEETYINEEVLGAFALNNLLITPLFYQFKLTYKTSEINIDATTQTDSSLQIKTVIQGKNIPVVKKTLPKNTIFSSMFPAWLYKNISTLKPNQPVSILALIEDKYTTGFPESAARIMLMDPDKTALASKTKKISIVFNDLESTWWVYDDGSIFKILMPLQKALIEKSTEKDAKQFLNVSKK